MGRIGLDLALSLTSHDFSILRRGGRLCHGTALESVRPHQRATLRRIHHPDFSYLHWMEEARRTGRCHYLWKVLTQTCNL